MTARVLLLLSMVSLQAQAQVGDDWLRKALTSPRVGARSAPSDAIYPPQRIELKFSHATHVEAGVDCQACHDAVDRSVQPSDRHIPGHAQCTDCHEIDEAAAGQTVDPPSACSDCHRGFAGPTGEPQRSNFPAAHLKFAHAPHLARGAECADCHLGVDTAELATRSHLPRMRTCLGCHDGKAASDRCQTCHLAEPDGILVTRFSSGTLAPTGTLRNDDHGADFLRRHAHIARAELESCGSCHRDAECEACHASSSKAFRVHPPDWVQTHSVSARGGDMSCQSCHREQSFCVSCHQQLGVARESRLRQPGMPLASQRFHPEGFVAGTRSSPNHHSFAAQSNIQSCVSCHTEQTCLQCHAADGAVDQVSPHPPGWATSGVACRALKQAPVSCAKCHGSGAGLAGLGARLPGCR